jgi:hypothetical protein
MDRLFSPVERRRQPRIDYPRRRTYASTRPPAACPVIAKALRPCEEIVYNNRLGFARGLILGTCSLTFRLTTTLGFIEITIR